MGGGGLTAASLARHTEAHGGQVGGGGGGGAIEVTSSGGGSGADDDLLTQDGGGGGGGAGLYSPAKVYPFDGGDADFNFDFNIQQPYGGSGDGHVSDGGGGDGEERADGGGSGGGEGPARTNTPELPLSSGADTDRAHPPLPPTAQTEADAVAAHWRTGDEDDGGGGGGGSGGGGSGGGDGAGGDGGGMDAEADAANEVQLKRNAATAKNMLIDAGKWVSTLGSATVHIRAVNVHFAAVMQGQELPDLLLVVSRRPPVSEVDDGATDGEGGERSEPADAEADASAHEPVEEWTHGVMVPAAELDMLCKIHIGTHLLNSSRVRDRSTAVASLLVERVRESGRTADGNPKTPDDLTYLLMTSGMRRERVVCVAACADDTDAVLYERARQEADRASVEIRDPFAGSFVPLEPIQSFDPAAGEAALKRLEEGLVTLKELGFSGEEAREALTRHHNDVEAAANELFTMA